MVMATRPANPTAPVPVEHPADLHGDHAQPRLEPGLFCIRGHPRSGTNWVGRLLNLHPEVCCRGEFHFQVLQNAVEHFCSHQHQLGSRPHIEPVVRAKLDEMVRACLRAAFADQPDARWRGDRTPSPLRAMFDDTRHILVRRDGRDVLVSFTFHQLRGAGGVFTRLPFQRVMAEQIAAFAHDPRHFDNHPEQLLSREQWVRHAARQWATRALDDEQTRAQLDQRSAVPPVLVVCYEQLHEDIEAQRTRLYRYLDLDPTRAEPIDRASGTVPGFRQDNPAAFRRKGEVGDWKRYFTDDTKRWFKEEAGEALVRLGYESTQDW